MGLRWVLLLLAIGLFGCEDPAAQHPIAQTQPEQQAELAQLAPLEGVWPEMSAARFGDLDELLDFGEIRVLVPVSLGGYHITQGQPGGAFYESTLLLQDFVKKKLGKSARKIRITAIPVRRDQLIPFLMQGFGDLVIGNLTITPDRSELVDFSRPISRNVRELLITGPASPEITTIADLAGKSVVTRRSSSYFESLSDLSQRFVDQGQPPIEIIDVDPRLEDEDLLDFLNGGLIDYIVVDEHKMGVWQKIFDQIVVRDDIVLREGGQMAIALRKESPKLKALIDEFTAKYPVGSKITNILINRYFERTHWVEDAIKLDPFHNLDELEVLFKKYGEQYQIDWMLLAAFAYQESRFNQNARSRAGAVGVMQLLPSTAADKNVNIPDISKLENNVHAGAKYLAFLRDRYFVNEEINGTESMLFTMAAYNAGPRRINQLRKDAAKRGLDPNIWFNNVEEVVAARVGREPVRYVGNIYRYYVAYKRTTEESQQRRELKQTLRDELQG